MTTIKNDKLSLEDVESILEKEVASGAILCTCPECKQYLSQIEYKTKKCFSCKKEIVFENILYYPGLKKENN